MAELHNDFSLAHLANQENFDVSHLRQEYQKSVPGQAGEVSDKKVLIWMRQQIQRDESFSSAVSTAGLSRLKTAARQLGYGAELQSLRSGSLKKLSTLFTGKTAEVAKLGAKEALAQAEKTKLSQLLAKSNREPASLTNDEKSELVFLIGNSMHLLSKAERAAFAAQFTNAAVMTAIINDLSHTPAGQPESTANKAFRNICKEGYVTGDLQRLFNMATIPYAKQNLIKSIGQNAISDIMRYSFESKFSLTKAITSLFSTPEKQISIPTSSIPHRLSPNTALATSIIADAAVEVVQRRMQHPNELEGMSSVQKILKDSIITQLMNPELSEVKLSIPQSSRTASSLAATEGVISRAIMNQSTAQRILGHTSDADLEELKTIQDIMHVMRQPNAPIANELKVVTYDLLSVWASTQKQGELGLLREVYSNFAKAHESSLKETVLQHATNSATKDKLTELGKLLYSGKPSFEDLIKIVKLFDELNIPMPKEFPSGLQDLVLQRERPQLQENIAIEPMGRKKEKERRQLPVAAEGNIEPIERKKEKERRSLPAADNEGISAEQADALANRIIEGDSQVPNYGSVVINREVYEARLREEREAEAAPNYSEVRGEHGSMMVDPAVLEARLKEEEVAEAPPIEIQAESSAGIDPDQEIKRAVDTKTQEFMKLMARKDKEEILKLLRNAEAQGDFVTKAAFQNLEDTYKKLPLLYGPNLELIEEIKTELNRSMPK